MLKNVSKEDVVLRYNGLEKVIKPGKSLNVLDFGISAKEVGLLENRFGSKFNGKLKVTPQPADATSGDLEEARATIESQNAELETLRAENEALKEENESLKADLKKAVEINEKHKGKK